MSRDWSTFNPLFDHLTKQELDAVERGMLGKATKADVELLYGGRSKQAPLHNYTPFAESPANPAASVQSPITQADAAGNASGGQPFSGGEAE